MTIDGVEAPVDRDAPIGEFMRASSRRILEWLDTCPRGLCTRRAECRARALGDGPPLERLWDEGPGFDFDQSPAGNG